MREELKSIEPLTVGGDVGTHDVTECDRTSETRESRGERLDENVGVNE